MPDSTYWLIMGDFNFIRYPENRNRAGADTQDMFSFNDAISSQALVEIPLKNRSFTWSNMQQAPLLEKLDQIFSSESWTLNYPNTLAFPLAKPISDHTPCVIKVGTKIPKSQIVRFENFWLNHHDFKDTVKHIWDQNIQESDSAKRLAAKLKRLRKGLKIWSKNISQLATAIQDTNSVILFFDTIEEFRNLAPHEWEARLVLKEHLVKLLNSQQVYWKQRATIRWISRGETNAKFLKAKATIKFRNNHIAVLQNEQGQEQSDHDSKVAILWRAFKQRLGTSVPTHNLLHLESLIEMHDDLLWLEEPFTKSEIDVVVKELPPDKAPGPDGFNTNFIKACWDIIAEDFYSLITDFYHGKVNIQSINSSYITLIPKK